MPNPRDIVTAERVIHAPPAAIFDLLAAPDRHPDFDGSGSVKGLQPGGPARLTEGAIFGMDMQQGLRYGMVNTVTEFEEGRRIAWSPKPANGRGARFVGRIWRYELEPVEGGTRVRETWDISHEGIRHILRYVAASRTRRHMEKSLEKLEDLVTSGS
jgi:uncharacterized protein YndB with AHSA1/START domain